LRDSSALKLYHEIFAFYPLSQFVKVGSQKTSLADEGHRTKMLTSALWLSACRITQQAGWQDPADNNQKSQF